MSNHVTDDFYTLQNKSNTDYLPCYIRYVEAVFPGEYGIKQKPLFFVTRDYWFGASQKPEQVKILIFIAVDPSSY